MTSCAAIPDQVAQKPMPGRPLPCTACTRAAFFQARVESPAGPEFVLRRVNACAGHLVEVIIQLRAWACRRHVSCGRLTLLAIDPYALSRLAARNVPAPGFIFYSAPLTDPLSADVTEPGGTMASLR
jgi:hypothetical protein